MTKNRSRENKHGALMRDFKLDPKGPLPLYYQLMVCIRGEIAKGTWKEEEVIPSENEISTACGISVGSVRKALDGLVQDGILFRKHGKGTFVAEPDFRFSYVRYFHSSNSDPGHDSLPISEVLSIKTELPQHAAKKILKLTGKDRVILIKRLRRIQGVPALLENIFLPTKYFPDIDQFDFAEDPLYPIYAKKYHVPVIGADDYYESKVASVEEAEGLKIRRGDPVIFIERIAYTHGDKPVEYRKCTGRGDHFRYHVGLGRRGEKTG
jgi:GntR family transcriptional regulator